MAGSRSTACAKAWTLRRHARPLLGRSRPWARGTARNLAPPVPPQFFWLWSPTNFKTGGFFFHTNDDGRGRAWNRRAVWQPDGASRRRHIDDAEVPAGDVETGDATRNPAPSVVTIGIRRASARSSPTRRVYEFYMLGLGYGHPKWGHGLNHGRAGRGAGGPQARPASIRACPTICMCRRCASVTYREASGRIEETGRAVFEQLAIGPHAPSGFKSMLDMAQ